MGMAFNSVDPWYDEVVMIHRPKFKCVHPVIDGDIYSWVRESSVTVQYYCVGKNSSPYDVSCPRATMKDSDYHKENPMCEEQHNHFL